MSFLILHILWNQMNINGTFRTYVKSYVTLNNHFQTQPDKVYDGGNVTNDMKIIWCPLELLRYILV